MFINKLKNIYSMLRHHFHNSNKYVNYVSETTGWSLKETKKRMNEARNHGISYKYYAKKRLWNRTPEQMEKVAKRARKHALEAMSSVNHYIEETAKITGLSQDQVRENVTAARKISGCSFKDYYKFKMYDLTPEQQATFFTNGVFEALSFKYNPDPEAIATLLKKDRFARKYRDLFHRVWFTNRKLTFERFCEKTKGLDAIICKPVSATQGKGVVKYTLADYADNLHELYDELIAMPKMICEECIVQHPAMAAFNSTSVNTVRVLTIVDSGKCHHIYAGFRMGRGGLVDNFHAGGIIASVDVKTGITCMDAIDLDGNHYPTHPTSGLPTLGFQIPNWDVVLDITEKAALRMEGAGIIGWDVAITPDGACLIEGNSEPSHTIIQLPYADSQVGMKYLVEEFLD